MAIQGTPNGITPPDFQGKGTQPLNKAPQGSGFNRTISALANTATQLPGSSSPPPGQRPLAERSVAHAGEQTGSGDQPESQLLSEQGLRNIAGDPKNGLIKKSPTYTKLLNTLNKYHNDYTSSSPEKKSQDLDDLQVQAEDFLATKAEKTGAKKVIADGKKKQDTRARVDGMKQLLTDIKTERASLALQAFQPTSLSNIADNKKAYESAGDFGRQRLTADLAGISAEDLAGISPGEFLEVVKSGVYPSEDLQIKHFSSIKNPLKGKIIFPQAEQGSPLKAAAGQFWANDKIRRTFSELPSTAAALTGAHAKLDGMKLPPQWLALARSALDEIAQPLVEARLAEGPIYENIPYQASQMKTLDVNTPSAPLTPLTLDEIKDLGNALQQGLESLNPSLTRPAEHNDERNRQESYNALSQPTFNAENNILHDASFVQAAKVRYGAGRERDTLPCPRDSVVKTGGKAIYHANHVNMPQGSYIAAQGPLQTNQDNYWAMLAGQKTPVSIDLTNHEDKSKPKRTIDYTPLPEKSTTYENGITVDNLGETTILDGKFTVQQLKINGQPHTRIQYNKFDDRTPGTPADMVALSMLARSISSNPAIPIAVHCSAGIGRTGTLISVMDQVDHQLAGKSHDPVAAIDTFRQARGSKGVQTPGQLDTILRTHENIADLVGAMRPQLPV